MFSRLIYGQATVTRKKQTGGDRRKLWIVLWAREFNTARQERERGGERVSLKSGAGNFGITLDVWGE